MREIFKNQIVQKLNEHKASLRAAFLSSNSATTKTRTFYLDNLLPHDSAQAIFNAFPPVSKMRAMDSFREKKYTFKQLADLDPILSDITFAIQHPDVVAIVEEITDIKNQEPDSSLYAGGLSSMVKGDFLNPHLDNSHDGSRKRYRTLNLLYYITPDWQESFGGNLELWNDAVTEQVTIASLFNRLVVMETNQHSWHSVSPVVHDGMRCCVSNYYFSKTSPQGADYFNVTTFNARPGQSFRRVLCKLDNLVRQSIRKIKKAGLGKQDIYVGKN